jgi:mono/diheme cytochrome c family protein
MRNLKYIILALYASLLLYSCSPAEGNFPGSEYMPDMAHSIAYEANSYMPYRLNTWDSASVVSLRELSYPHLPVAGTVPRGYAGLYFAQQTGREEKMQAVLNGETDINAISVPMNGSVPYYYGNTEEERLRAIEEIIENPYPITAEGLKKGGDLYNIYCGICHGPAGDGLGYLVSEENQNAVYPAAPANFLLDDFVNSSNGRYYHTIMYGRNLMGPYKDKLNYEERWQVIHYIRSLQAADRDLQYNENVNTLNPAYGTPANELEKLAESRQLITPQVEEGDASEPEGGQHSDNETKSPGSGGY